MKILKAINISAIVLLSFASTFAQNPSKTTETKTNFWSKLVHNTEMGFLLGEQAALNNKTINPYYGYPIDVQAKTAYIADYYYPYPQYYGTNRYSNFTIQHFTGIAINKALNVGATAGFDYYRSNIITPLSLGTKATLLPSRRVSPIAGIDFGYGFIWKNETDKANKIDKVGGYMLNPSAGFRVKIGNNGSNLNVNIGYKMQKAGFTNNRPEESFYLTEKRAFNRLSIRLGFGF
jgi:hypothetical protein